MAKLKGIKARVELSPKYNVPHRIYDVEMPAPKTAAAKKGSPRGAKGDDASRQTAESFLRKIAGDIKINPDLSELKFDKVIRTILGTHVLFQQQHNGRPISSAWVKVDIDKKGRVFNVVNDLVPQPALKASAKAPPQAKVSREHAIQIALDAAGIKASQLRKIDDPELVYLPKDGQPTLTWKVLVKGTKPPREWKVYVGAEDGKVVAKFNLLKEVDGKGRVFNPNPVVALNDTTLENKSAIPDKAYKSVTLRGLEKTGFLDGEFVSTKRTANRANSSTFKFNFSRDDRNFKEVMVYFHIDQAQRYIQELGFDNVNNRSIEVNIDGTTQDNSFYSPMTKSLTFGTGGVDDAEDGDIVLHEYAHSIQDNIIPGFGPEGEARAMGEGFGDYFAGSFFEDLKAAKLKPCIGCWDAVAYSTAKPPNLRRLDSRKKYPADMTGEEHDDGEIWAACLWQLRTAVGRKVADRLVFAHHFLITATATFKDAAEALMTADKNLNGGKNVATIRDIFERRGILQADKTPEPKATSGRRTPRRRRRRRGRPKPGRRQHAAS